MEGEEESVMENREIGTVRYWKEENGYGFIKGDNNRPGTSLCTSTTSTARSPLRQDKGSTSRWGKTRKGLVAQHVTILAPNEGNIRADFINADQVPVKDHD